MKGNQEIQSNLKKGSKAKPTAENRGENLKPSSKKSTAKKGRGPVGKHPTWVDVSRGAPSHWNLQIVPGAGGLELDIDQHDAAMKIAQAAYDKAVGKLKGGATKLQVWVYDRTKTPKYERKDRLRKDDGKPYGSPR